MRTLIVFVLVSIAVYMYVAKYDPTVLGRPATRATSTAGMATGGGVTTQSKAKVETTFKCDGRIYCSQMKSRAEAEYFIQHCPNTKMDTDSDGVPCDFRIQEDAKKVSRGGAEARGTRQN